MTYFILLVVNGLIAIFLYKGLQWLIDRRRFPYRYKCKQCSFSFATNIRETYEISKSSHNHSSLHEYHSTDPWETPEVKAACVRFHPGEKCIPGRNHPAAKGS